MTKRGFSVRHYLVDIEAEDVIEYQHALILAMKQEKAAFRLYTDLAETAGDEETKRLFQGLATEEAKHKLRFEIEYDDQYMQEN